MLMSVVEARGTGKAAATEARPSHSTDADRFVVPESIPQSLDLDLLREAIYGQRPNELS